MEKKKWKHRAPQKSFSRAERKQQILGQFKIWFDKKDGEPKTMNRIARALGMTPSTAIADMLLELVNEGLLILEWRDRKGRYTTRYFAISETFEHYHEEYGKRRIVVKHKGVERGQLELWS